MNALEELAQAVLEGRVNLVPIVVHNVGEYEPHLAPVYTVIVDPKRPEDES